MKVRMLASTTRASVNHIVERPEKDARSLIDAGFAEEYKDPNAENEARLAALEERIGRLEAQVALPPVENASRAAPENAARSTKPAKPRGGKGKK